MNPHRLSWGVAQQFPVAILVGVATLAGFALSHEPRRMPRSTGTYLLFALWVSMTVSTIFALHFDVAFDAWKNRSKILLMVLVIMTLIQSRERLCIFSLVMAGSIGFFGFKGGLFALLTGAQYQVVGPEGTALDGNNAIALALNMVLPMLFYMGREVERRSLRLLLRAASFLTILAIVSTYSRGGLLGLATVLVLLYAKSGRRLLGAALIAAGLLGVLSFVPQEWSERMNTIESYEGDRSAMGRLNAWHLAWRLALARPVLGFGPDAMEDKTLYEQYYPESPTHNDVHGSYFQLLSEGGFTICFIFGSLICWCVVTTQRLSREFRGSSENGWVATYADMLQISICGYVVSATFLELAFFDYLYYVVGATIILRSLAQPLKAAQPVAQPVARASLVVASRSKDSFLHTFGSNRGASYGSRRHV
jgi:probable O-glycosylation ligase (exosortase A-associated)